MARAAKDPAKEYLNSILESNMQETIESLVSLRGGRIFHVNQAYNSPEMRDFPDLVIMVPGALAIVELKREGGELSTGQVEIDELLKTVDRVFLGVVRPSNLDALLEVLQ